MFGQLKAKLGIVEGKLKALLATIDGHTTRLEKDVTSLDTDALVVLDRVDAAIKKATTQGSQKLGAVRATLKRLSPPA